MYAPELVVLVVFTQGLQHSQFQTRCIAIFLYGSDDFDGNVFSALGVVRLDDFAKCSLAE